MSRAIGYLRVSTGRQAEEGAGLDVQRLRVEQYAQTHSLELVDVVEEAASGMTKAGEVFSWEHRPVLLDLIAHAKDPGYDVLVVASFDRLSRDLASLVAVERMLGQHGVEVVSTGEDNGDSADAKMLRGIKAVLGEYEAGLIRSRLAAGKAIRRAQGRNVSGAAPYGYAARKGSLLVVEAEAEVVRRIFRAVRAGQSARAVARVLNEHGIPAPRGGTWAKSQVLSVVRNRTYRGERHGAKAAHEALVDVRLWNGANRALRRR